MPLCIPSLATFGVQRLILVNPCLFPCLQVVGHLFDDKVINRIMDLVVDGPCTFRVSDLKVGHVNEVHSSACTHPLVWCHWMHACTPIHSIAFSVPAQAAPDDRCCFHKH